MRASNAPTQLRLVLAPSLTYTSLIERRLAMRHLYKGSLSR